VRRSDHASRRPAGALGLLVAAAILQGLSFFTFRAREIRDSMEEEETKGEASGGREGSNGRVEATPPSWSTFPLQAHFSAIFGCGTRQSPKLHRYCTFVPIRFEALGRTALGAHTAPPTKRGQEVTIVASQGQCCSVGSRARARGASNNNSKGRWRGAARVVGAALGFSLPPPPRWERRRRDGPSRP
jgi:hypothetical protein